MIDLRQECYFRIVDFLHLSKWSFQPKKWAQKYLKLFSFAVKVFPKLRQHLELFRQS